MARKTGDEPLIRNAEQPRTVDLEQATVVAEELQEEEEVAEAAESEEEVAEVIESEEEASEDELPPEAGA